MKRLLSINAVFPTMIILLALLVAACGGGSSGGSGGSGGTASATVPSSIDFGVVLLNGDIQSREILVTNTGSDSLRIDTIPAAPAPFVKGTDNCSGKSLSPRAECTLTVDFDPNNTGPGDQTDYNKSMTIPTNVGNNKVRLMGKVRAYHVAINDVDYGACGTNRLRVLLSVTDNTGGVVAGIGMAEFDVFEDSGAVTVQAVTNPFDAPISIALALDYSSSVSDAYITAIRAAAKNFVNDIIDVGEDEAGILRIGKVLEYYPASLATQSAQLNREMHPR